MLAIPINDVANSACTTPQVGNDDFELATTGRALTLCQPHQLTEASMSAKLETCEILARPCWLLVIDQPDQPLLAMLSNIITVTNVLWLTIGEQILGNQGCRQLVVTKVNQFFRDYIL